MRRRDRSARALLCLLLAGLVLAPCLLLAGPAWAEDGGAEAKPADAEPAELEADRLETRILEHEGARWAFLLGRIVPIVIGVVLLVLWYLRNDKIKGGALPAPPRVHTTLAMPLGEAVLWSAGAMFLGPAALAIAMAGGQPVDSLPMWQQLLAMAACTVGVAVYFLLRRQRMQLASADGLEGWSPEVTAPTPPPPPGRALALGAWTYCVAGVVFLPVMIVWGLLLQGLGSEPVTQAPVREVVESSSSSGAILMVVFGVLVAPFTEECIFRGMLYPGIKRVLGGDRRAVWLGTVIVSAIFAAIHFNLYAALPLFALAMVLNWVFEKTNSLAACIIAHALHNGITMVPLLILRGAS